MTHLNIISILAILFFFMACGTARQTTQLNHHRKTLTRTVNSPIHPEQKLDTLATSFVNMMDQGLKILNPKKGLAYVTEYSQQNEKSIDALLVEIGAWQKEMKTVEKITYGLRLIQKPYAKQFVDLIGKFERKYQQVKFVSKLSKKVKSGLMAAGMKELGL